MEGLAGGVAEEVRRVSEWEGREVLRDRRALRRGRKGRDGRREGRAEDAGSGGESGGQLVGGEEERQESEDEGWEEEVVEMYRGTAMVEENAGSRDVRPGGEDPAWRYGGVDHASCVDITDGGGDAERRAEEYRRLLSPRPESETPVSSSGSVRHGWRPARDGRERESDVYETRETTARKATATRRRHGQ